MPTDAKQSVPSRVSRHFKWMERSQYGGSHRRAMNASHLPLKPFHLFTCIDWAKEGGEEKKVSGILHEQFPVHLHALRDFILGELRAWWRLRQQDQIQSHLDRTNEGKCQVWIQNNNQTRENMGYRLTWIHSKGHQQTTKHDLAAKLFLQLTATSAKLLHILWLEVEVLFFWGRCS